MRKVYYVIRRTTKVDKDGLDIGFGWVDSIWGLYKTEKRAIRAMRKLIEDRLNEITLHPDGRGQYERLIDHVPTVDELRSVRAVHTDIRRSDLFGNVQETFFYDYRYLE